MRKIVNYYKLKILNDQQTLNRLNIGFMYHNLLS